jgi:RNA polymerase sigma-70 factor (ECF subfamily)
MQFRKVRFATHGWIDESDASLLESIAAGSEDALSELIRRHRRRISSVVGRILSCSADVEEVVQDVFVLIWKHASRFRAEAKATTWIRAIARNAAVSRLRRADSATLSIDVLLGDAGALVAAQPDPERQAVAAELARHTWSRIAKLPALHRRVIVGMVRHISAGTVAVHHRLPTGTVKSRLHRARAALRATHANASSLAGEMRRTPAL